MHEMPPQQYLQECFAYDPEAGTFLWRARPLTHFRNARGCNVFNALYAGSSALNTQHSDGYLIGRLRSLPGGKCAHIYAHRVAWKLTYGAEPAEVDHINGIRDDNRLVNLRAVTPSENQRNTALGSNNKSGLCGIRRDARGRWIVRINNQHIAVFDTRGEAIASRLTAERLLGFSKTHGRRAAIYRGDWDNGRRIGEACR